MIKFTVLLSVYKNEKTKYLDEALNSILIRQTVLPNEVVIIKDGKLTSELNDTIFQWSQHFPHIIKIIELKKNVGLGNSLNEGVKNCSNEWVFRMDTDDCCTPTRFEKQLKYIKDNPDIVLLGSHIEEFNISMSHSLGYRKVPCCHNGIFDYMKKRNPFNHMTVAFRKDIVELVGGYQHHSYMEDYNLWIRVIASGHQVANLNDILVHVRAGSSMVKRRKGLNYIKSELQLAKLKIEKRIDSPLSSYLNFILRSIPRILPTLILAKVYNKLRK